MLQLSVKMPIFAPSVEKDWRHRGELLSFDPLENLQNSKYKGEKLKLLLLQKHIYCLLRYGVGSYIYLQV